MKLLTSLLVLAFLYLQVSFGEKRKDLRTILQEIRELLDVREQFQGASDNIANPDVIKSDSDGITDDPDDFIIPGMRVEHNGGIEAKPIGLTREDPFRILNYDDEINDDDNVPNKKRKKRNLKSFDALWPKGKVPYIIDERQIDTPFKKETIEKAIQVMMNLTCVQFLPLSNQLLEDLGHNNYVNFTAIKGCTSHVGMVRPAQGISLTNGCFSVNTILHEMLHAIGFWHEQDRSDRDLYIRMIGSGKKEMPKRNSINFAQYDLQSIMQYKLRYQNGTKMEVLDQNQKFLVKAQKKNTLQFYDVEDVTSMYNCSAHCDKSHICEHGGFLDHRCRCFCPDHLTGSKCENVNTDQDCGGIIDVEIGKEMHIQSRNYPYPYPINKMCRWLFRGQSGYHLRITIDDMQLPYNNLDRCYHWLEIRYNNLGQTGILRCGEAAGLTYTSSRDSPTLMMVGFDSKTNPDRTPKKVFSYRVYLVGDHCLNNPCNFGRCIENGNGYNCICESGFNGQHCEQMQGRSCLDSITIQNVTDHSGKRDLTYFIHASGQTFSCNFDNDQKCLFINTANGDQLDWTISKFATPYEDKGPIYARIGDGFLMADMVDKGALYDVAHFETAFPLIAEDRCLSFFYNMNGQNTSTLNVKSKSSQSPYFSTIWSTHGNQGPKWHYAEVFMATENNLELLFEAVKGSGPSVIALDNIILKPGPCDFQNFDDTIHITTENPSRLDLVDYDMNFDGIGWINFEVHACKRTTIELQTETKNSNDSYRLLLGDNGNTWAYVHKFINGEKEISFSAYQPTINCDNYEPFWFGWKNNKLQLGRGFVFGENIIITGTDPNPYDVKHVIVLSSTKANWVFYKGNCVSGFGQCLDTGYCIIPMEVCDNVKNCADGSDENECAFPACDASEFRCTYGRCYPGTAECDREMNCSDESDELDCPIHVDPRTHISLSGHGLNPVRDTVFKFTVKTCSDASVTLLKGNSEIYKVKLGKGGNTYSTLKRVGGSYVRHNAAIVDCKKYLPFYISWSDSIVKVGKGPLLGHDVFLQLQDSHVSQIDEIQVGSYADDVFFNIEEALPSCASNEFRCGYGRCIADSTRCDGIKHCTDGSDEKDCPILVPKYGKDIISSHQYNISGMNWINFEVQSCANAFITLLQRGEAMFAVMLGRGGNTWNSLFDYVLEMKKHKYNSQVLDCNTFKQFWLSWDDGHLKVGQGLHKGDNVLIELPNESSVNIDDVQLGSYSSDNIFKIRQGNCFDDLFKCSENDQCISSYLKCDQMSDCAASGGSDEQNCNYPSCDPERDLKCGYGMCFSFEKMCDGVNDCRDNSDEMKCPIRTAPYTSKVVSNQGFSDQSWVNFKVKTCADAQILLAKDEHVIYRVLLGRGGNSWSSIQKDKTNRVQKTGNVLDCDEFLPFWVSWQNGDIEVGKGLKPFENTHLSWSDENYETVNEVIVKSYAKEGEWYFEQDPCNSQREFQCSYGRCLPSGNRCDGFNDCLDKSDEKNCPIEIPILWTQSYFDLEPYGITGKGRTTLIFNADACCNLFVGLMPNKYETSSMYKIGIGRGDNGFNTIQKNDAQVKRSDSQILDCSSKQLWVSWKDGRIAAGEGLDVTKNVAIEWTDGDPLAVNDIGVSSWNEKWTFQNIEL